MDTLLNIVYVIAAISLLGLGFAFVVAILIFVVISFNDYQKTHWASWQKLARVNGLTYTPPGLFTHARVVGIYKGHPLVLESFQKAEGRSSYTATRVTVSARNRRTGYLWLKDEDFLNVPLKVEDLTTLFDSASLKLSAINEEITATANGQTISFLSRGIETNIDRLQNIFNWLVELSQIYPMLIALGGEAISTLQTIARRHSSRKPLITRLMGDIARETTRRLGNPQNTLFCPDCLTCCGPHKISLGWWQSITYYGCRNCSQSRRFFEGSMIVAVLDNQTTTELSHQHGALYLNWTISRKLSDFSAVQIVQATDEEIERFAVQIGNDTDPVRRSRYSQLPCTITPTCHLSPNSLRILQRTFSSVTAANEQVESTLSENLSPNQTYIDSHPNIEAPGHLQSNFSKTEL